MANSYPVSVGTKPTVLVSAPPASGFGATGWFLLQNSTAATLYVGGSGVTSSNGVQVGTSATTNSFSGYVFPGDVLWGATASGTATTTVLVTGASQ